VNLPSLIVRRLVHGMLRHWRRGPRRGRLRLFRNSNSRNVGRRLVMMVHRRRRYSWHSGSWQRTMIGQSCWLFRRHRLVVINAQIVGRVNDFAYVTPNGPGQMIVQRAWSYVVTLHALDRICLEDLLWPTRSAVARSVSRATFRTSVGPPSRETAVVADAAILAVVLVRLPTCFLTTIISC
jgi:hypothetical protein